MSLHPLDAQGRPAKRHWRDVMRPARLAAMQPSRLSITRALVARMVAERWDIKAERFDVDAAANGTVVYSVTIGDRAFSFIGFSHTPSPKGRTGRIIGRSWDMMGTLNEGSATEAHIESARAELPKLYRGRATRNSLVWCRSNRSMRAFEGTLEALKSGRQPKIEDLNGVCYLMRNTGLDGNGTFGTRPFPSLGPDHPLGGPLEAQLLTAYLMREFSCDLVEHLARLQSEHAVTLDPAIRRWLGVGNGSALGLIFYVQKHPSLMGAWIEAREQAIAEALALPASPETVERLGMLLGRAIRFRREDRMVYETFSSSGEIADDLTRLLDRLSFCGGAFPLRDLADWAARETVPEAYETLLSLLVELVPDRAAALSAQVQGSDEMSVNPRRTVAETIALLERDYDWALTLDMSAPEAMSYVWYKSETAEEPRRGRRDEIPEARDLGLDVPGEAQALLADLRSMHGQTTMSRFLLSYPRHRQFVARIQTLESKRYHTPMANIHDDAFVPIDLVRLMNVGFHGIDKTRDYLSRNLRGVLFHGAPTPGDIRAGKGGEWSWPPEPADGVEVAE